MKDATTLDAAMDLIRSAASKMKQDVRFYVDFEEYPALDEDGICAMEEWLQEQPGMAQQVIPGELKALYRSTGGLRFVWRYKETQPATVGSIGITDLMSLYQGDDEREKSVSKLHSEPRIFDVIDQYRTVLLSFPMKMGDSVGLYHLDKMARKRCKVNLTVDQYLVEASKVLARYGWQRCFTGDRSLDEFEAMREEIGHLAIDR